MDDAIRKTYAAQDSGSQRAMWLGRIRENLEEICGCADAGLLQGMFQDCDGIVAGAGPSLRKNIDLLKSASRTHPIFCCDRATPMLRDAGVTPHVVVVADASERVGEFLEGCETAKMILAAPAYAHKSVFRKPWRKKLVFLPADEDASYMSAARNIISRKVPAGVSTIPGGVIVGNAAMICARIAGCATIAFVGCDMSMKEEPQGVVSYEREDENGEKIYSLPGFLAGLEWLLKFTRLDTDIKNGKVIIYNSTEGGIMYGEGITGIKLSEYLEKHAGSSKSLETMINRKLGR